MLLGAWLVAVECLGLVLAQQQQAGGCTADVVRDGIVDVNDLLALLSDFGQRQQSSSAAGSATIVVGGGDGWVVKPGNAVYEDIVASVGDTLQFTYSSHYHDVMLLAAGGNEQCDFSAGTMLDETGDLAWIAPAPGTYVFACTRGDHCLVGNQLVRAVVTEPDGAAGRSDLQRDGVVDVNDLLALLAAYGGTCASQTQQICALGQNCGGQLQQPCGTPCSLVCGQEVRCCQQAACDDTCTAGYQCPPTSPWWRPAPGTEPSIIRIGGAAGWAVQPYAPVSARVGDTLIFTHEGDHNLYLVDNEQCDFVSAVGIDEYTGGLSDGVYDSGITRRMRGGTEHELTTVGRFVFACTRGSHCANGQQVVVTVEPAAVQSGVCVTEAECLVEAGR